MRTLILAQVLAAVGLAAGGTAGALLAGDLTGDTAAAGVPLALLVLGSGVGAVAITRIMDRAGRRIGLAVAHLLGAAGAALAVAAAALSSAPLLFAGSVLLGFGNAAVMLARYAAADLAELRGHAISVVMTAASVGAVAGPNLLGPTGSLASGLGLPQAAGLYLIAIPAFGGAAVVIGVFLRPDPLLTARAAAATGGPPLGFDPTMRLALLLLATANLTMVAIMAVAPVHMRDDGAGLAMVGLIVSAHIGAMYLPSPVTGALADRFGGRRVGAAGAAVLAAAGLLALATRSSIAGTAIVLLLLGVGWNAGLIAGSALLREAPVHPARQTQAEGLGELGMGAAAALGGTGGGMLLGASGFTTLCFAAAVPPLLLLTYLLPRRLKSTLPKGVPHDHPAPCRPRRRPRGGVVPKRPRRRGTHPNRAARRAADVGGAVVRRCARDDRRRVPGHGRRLTADPRRHVPRPAPAHRRHRRGVAARARCRGQGVPPAGRHVLG